MIMTEKVILQYDTFTEPFIERDVLTKIRSLLEPDAKMDNESYSDALAFEFTENDKNNSWGTYLSSVLVLNNPDGSQSEYPSITDITPDMIEHWKKRYSQVSNPILKARFGNLLWDFSKKVTGTNPGREIAHSVIDCNIEISKTGIFKYDIIIKQKLARALSLAISIKDYTRIQSTIAATIDFEDKIAQDGIPATWGFSFDFLISDKTFSKKIKLTPEQESKIVADLEARLERLSAPDETEKVDHWSIEAAVMRLAPYYRNLKRPDDIKRILSTFGKAFDSVAKSSSPLIASSLYEQVRSLYHQYGVTDKAKQIEVIIHELGPKVISEFKQFSVPFNLEQGVLEGHIAEMLDGDLETARAKIVFQFIPDKEQAENTLKDIANECPLSYSLQNQLYDHDGRPVASIDSIDKDLDGHLISHISKSMEFEIPFLHYALSGFIEKFGLTKDDIVNMFFESPIFDMEKRGIFEAGVEAYLNNNHMVAAHLLIPQVEAAMRNLLSQAHGSVYRPNKNGGFDYKTFGDLLTDDLFKVIISDLFGDDTNLYFKILFIEKRGWNIRNDVCHGLMRAESFQKPITDRIMHVLILLSRIQPVE